MSVATPQKVSGIPLAVARVAVSHGITCAITSDTALWCWGASSGGGLGYSTGTAYESRTPEQVTALGTGVTKVAVGLVQTCAVKSDGTLWCWGRNAGTVVATPTQIESAGNTVIDVSAGDENACIVKSDGTVWCWGQDTSGQDGDGIYNTSDPATPQQVPGVASATAIACGQDDCCAIASTRPICWGSNQVGNLGVGITDKAIVGPSEVLLPCLGTSPESGR
jgi:alpha-tubulin suppressor-like RCC1 family protein